MIHGGRPTVCMQPMIAHTGIEHLDLENKQLARIAFVVLSKLVYDHNSSALRGLQKADILNDEKICH